MRFNFIKILSLIVLSSAFYAVVVWAALRPDPTLLIYFDPDSAQGNLGRLKDEMNRFMQSHGLDIQVQPVARIDAFEKLIADSAPLYIVVPRWYLVGKRDSGPLLPMMASLANGNPEYRKVIVVRQDSLLMPGDLGQKQVAMAMVNRKAARDLLASSLFVPNGLDPDAPRFILTSRDYDSLIALLLGKVEAAVVVEHSLLRLGLVNKAMVKSVKIIGFSGPLPTPVLCRRNGAGSETSLLSMVMLRTTDQKQSEKFMQLLGFNGWKIFSEPSKGRGETEK